MIPVPFANRVMARVWSPHAAYLSLRNPARHFSSMSEASPLEFKPVDTDERTDNERPARLDVRTKTVEMARWHAAAHDAGMLLSEWVRMTLNAAAEQEAVPARLTVAGIRKANKALEQAPSAVVDGKLGVAIHPDSPLVKALAKDRAKVSQKVKTCIHGTEKDYRCWQCGGLARLE